MTEKKLDANYWDNQYKNNETGWDIGKISTPLKEYIDQIGNKNIKILIPGCGNCYEAEYLLEKGFTNVTLIDISKTLVENLQQKFQKNNEIKVIEADFFSHTGVYDLMLEQTFFCALNPKLRTKYISKTYDLLAPNGKLVGVLFNKEFEIEGPPFGGTQKEYKELFEPYFRIKTMENCYNSIPKRINNELFINLVKIHL